MTVSLELIWNIIIGLLTIGLSLLACAVTYGKLQQKVESMCTEHSKYTESHEKDHEREHVESREKFKELYESRNNMNDVIVRLSTLMEQVFERLGSIDGKIDRAIEGKK